MQINNCLYCNKIINYESNEQLCNECKQEILKIIKEYLQKNKFANIGDIYNNTKIPIKIIKEFIKNDRLEYQSQTLRKDLEKDNKIIGNPNYGIKSTEKKHMDETINNIEKPKMHFINKKSRNR